MKQNADNIDRHTKEDLVEGVEKYLNVDIGNIFPYVYLIIFSFQR